MQYIRKLIHCVLAIGLLVAISLYPTDHSNTQATILTSTSPVILPCGTNSIADISQPLVSAPTNPVNQVASNQYATYFAEYDNSGAPELYVYDYNQRKIFIYDLGSNTLVRSFSLPVQMNDVFALDTSGNLYMAQFHNTSTLYKISATGTTIWTKTLSTAIYSLFAFNGQIGVIFVNATGSTMLDYNGNVIGTNAITGYDFNADSASGKLVTTDGKYIRIYSAATTLLTTIGSNQQGTSPGLNHFYQLGEATLADDGKLYISDGGQSDGIYAATPDGLYQGIALDQTLGYLQGNSSLYEYNHKMYFANGSGLAYVSMADLQNLVSQPKGTRPFLGFGASIASTATANYYTSNQTPSVSVQFDPWWTAHASDLTGQYTVRERKQILAGTTVSPTTFSIPSSGNTLSVPITLPAAAPGFYQVEVRLLKGITSVSTDCMDYSIGASGDTLSFSSLPSGADFGGPGPARSVELAHQLGLHLVRLTMHWSDLLSSATSTSPENFSKYDSQWQLASQESATDGITLEAQVGTAEQMDRDLVSDGNWQSRVQELVAHFKPYIHNWEAWNEPNNNYGNGTDYVNNILTPFYAGVKAADSSAVVVGGTALGQDLNFWNALANAGGFQKMDVIAIHPYQGNSSSYEEDSVDAYIKNLKSLMANKGVASKPIWETEHAWWSNGPANLFSQGDKLVRKEILLQNQGITNYNYFITEGGYGDFGLSYSLIQYSGSSNPYYVKPGALAAMEFAQQTAGRPLIGMLTTNAPHTFAALYGTKSTDGSGGQVVVLWSDDLAINLSLIVPGSNSLTQTDLLGATASLPGGSSQFNVQVDGSPKYIAIPASVTPSITGAESFGSNVALASAGSTASASASAPSNPASFVTQGTSTTGGNGNFSSMPMWVSALNDSNPSLTITFKQATTIDRILVATHSLGSTVTGLRSYSLQANSNGTWQTVGTVTDEFYQRMELVSFAAISATAIRLIPTDIDFGGYSGGIRPPFWSKGPFTQSTMDYGPATVFAFEAYAPGTTMTQAETGICLKVSTPDASMPLSAINVTFFTPGTTQEVASATNLTTQSDGTLTITNPSVLESLSDSTSYDVTVKATGFLRRKLSSVSHILSQCYQTSSAQALYLGDFDTSNVINILDIVTLIQALNNVHSTVTAPVFTVYPNGPTMSNLLSLIQNYNLHQHGD